MWETLFISFLLILLVVFTSIVGACGRVDMADKCQPVSRALARCQGVLDKMDRDAQLDME